MGTTTVRYDDIDKNVTEGVKQIRFALQDDIYLIDLGPENVKALREALAPFVKVASKAPDTTKVTRAKVPAGEIRAWVATQGTEIQALLKSDKGALPKSVIKAYNDANGTSY